MERLRLGDDSALNEIMERWEKPLVAFLYRYAANWSVALDLAQEAFVKVYQSRARYRPKSKFSTWLFSIASNLARNEARWRKRHPGSAVAAAQVEPTDLDREAADSSGPDDNANRHDRARLVQAAIASLPPELRTVVLLSEYEGLPQREIGEALGCSAKAVETRLYRARKQLREKLADLRD